MKFSSILFAAIGMTAFAAALPAPAANPEAGLARLSKMDLLEREAVASLDERAVVVDVLADVQACTDAVIIINTKYTQKKKYGGRALKAWSVEIVAQVKLLIAVIAAYPAGYKYPSIDVIVAIFVKLFVAIFVQLKVFIDVGGLLATILVTVDILLAVLLGLVADLLNIIVTLCVLIEAKIQVGICAKIISGCGGLISSLYLQVLVKLLIKAGLKISL